MSALAAAHWSLRERADDLARAEREGVELLVVGGGIAGAGVLRDAATRGLRALLVERDDFASGTSSRSSKMIHGGLRYIGEGQLGTTRQACRERDRLLRLDPNLVRPLGFVFPAWKDSKVSHWQVRAALWVYAALANFRRTSRFQMLAPEAVVAMFPGLRTSGLQGAGFFFDAQVDDARLVLETLRSARSLGCAAVNHAEVIDFVRGEDARLIGATVCDRLSDRQVSIRADVIVNATGPGVERVRGLDRPVEHPELRPAKGIHLVIPRGRISLEATLTFEAPDGRQVFLSPWDDMALIGTTDTFSDEIDEPVVTIDEVHYLLAAVNGAFPAAGLTTNDLCSVFAGVRPLAAESDADTPASSVSREERVYEDPSGLLSIAGGKLTTYRAMGEKMVDQVVRRLPASRGRQLSPSRTRSLPLRADDFDRVEFESELCREFGVTPARSEHLVRSYGSNARLLLTQASPEQRRPIGDSRFTLAEIPWCVETECPANLCDLLERRVRAALLAPAQGLPQLPEIAAAAQTAAGWDEETTRRYSEEYAARIRSRYQIAAPSPASSATRSAA